MGDTEHFSDKTLNHLIVQGQDNSGYGWNFGQAFGFDLTDAWTQLAIVGAGMMLYGVFLIVYVTTKKFSTKPSKPKSQAWHVWDRNEVSYRLPVVSRHNDFLGWNEREHYKDFDGRIYLYCTPLSGPYQDFTTYIKQRILKRFKFENLPYRGFFFSRHKHYMVDLINNTEKKFPFTELRQTLQDTDLMNIPNIAISLPKDPRTGNFTMKFNPNFALDRDLEREIQETFERLKPELVEFNSTQGIEVKGKDLQPIIQPSYVKTVG